MVSVELRGVGGLGEVLEPPAAVLGSDLIFKTAGGGLDGMDSGTWKWSRMCHELDQQLYLVLEAMTFWVRTGFADKGGGAASGVM